MTKNHTFRNISLTFFMVCLSLFLVIPEASAISGQVIVGLTNTERQSAGLPALAWNGSLSSSAAAKGRDMCDKGYWAHTAPDGATGWTFMTAAGYGYRLAGENLAKGFGSDDGVVTGWMASPGHRANILNSEYRDVGVASVSCAFQGVETTIVVAHYGVTKAAVKSAAPAPAPKQATKPRAVVPQPKKPATVSTPVAPEVPKQPLVLPAPKPKVGEQFWQLLKTRRYSMLTILREFNRGPRIRLTSFTPQAFDVGDRDKFVMFD